MNADDRMRMLRLERRIESLENGVIPSGTLTVVSQTGRAMIRFAPRGMPEVIDPDHVFPATTVSLPGYPRCPAIAVGRAFQDTHQWASQSERLDFAMTLDGVTWWQSLPRTDLIATGVRSGTAFTVTDASANPVPVAYMLLFWGGQYMKSGTDYALAADGVSIDTSAGIGVPGVGSADFAIPLAWGKVTT